MVIKNNSNKKIYIISCSIVIIFVVSFFTTMISIYFTDSDSNYYIKNFKKNKDSFNNIIEYCINLNDKLNADEIRIFFDGSSGKKKVKMYYDDTKSINNFSDLDIFDEIEEDIKKVEDSFADLYWDGILITSEKIIFTTEGNQYAIAYSINGHRPNYMRSMNEKADKVKYIGDNWYFLSA